MTTIDRFIHRFRNFFTQSLLYRFSVAKDRPRFLLTVLSKAKPISKIFGFAEVVPFKYDAKGALCFSADLELAWAWRHSKPHPRLSIGKRSRESLPVILKVLDHYNIPITFAIVGHLFLEYCERDPMKGLPHPNMPRPMCYFENEYAKWERGDWYQHDPCTSVRENPLWYAPDLIHKILGSEVKHEIGTHSFSHIDFSSASCSHDLALKELQECIKVMKKYGLTPRSITFPYNFEGHFDVLYQTGIIAFRGYYGAPKIQYPKKTNEELWDIHQSLLFNPLPHLDYVRKCRQFIDDAIRHTGVFHVYFHPSELNESIVKKILIPVLEYACEKKKTGDLWIATMGEIARYCEAREKTKLIAEQKNEQIRIKVHSAIDHSRFGIPCITVKVKLTTGASVEAVYFDGDSIRLDTKECYLKGSFLVITFPVNVDEILIRARSEEVTN